MKSGVCDNMSISKFRISSKFRVVFLCCKGSTIPEASFVLNYHPVLGFKFNCFCFSIYSRYISSNEREYYIYLFSSVSAYSLMPNIMLDPEI
jgi:hypothetical protein